MKDFGVSSSTFLKRFSTQLTLLRSNQKEGATFESNPPVSPLPNLKIGFHLLGGFPFLSMERCLHVTYTFFKSNRNTSATRKTDLLVGSSFYKHDQSLTKAPLLFGKAAGVACFLRASCTQSLYSHTPVWRSQSTNRYKTVRVLLKSSRRVVSLVCIKNKLPVYPDTSNRSIKYSRNRIRKQILPSLQFFLNPQVENAIVKFSELSKFELKQ